VVAQLRGDRAALYHLFRVVPKLALAPSSSWCSASVESQRSRSPSRSPSSLRRSPPFAGCQGARSDGGEGCLFARRHALAGVPQAGRAFLPCRGSSRCCGVNIGLRSPAPSSRVHPSRSTASAAHLLRRPDLRIPVVGSPCSCSRRSPVSCTRPCRGSKACCARARANTEQREFEWTGANSLGTRGTAGARADRQATSRTRGQAELWWPNRCTRPATCRCISRWPRASSPKPTST
jgi:hypothetical protein